MSMTGRSLRFAVSWPACAGLGLALPAHAHGLAVPPDGAISFGWDFAPWVAVLLGVSLLAYVAGLARVAVRGGGTARSVRLRQAAAFLAGWLFLLVALCSPLDTLSGALFSAHMVQHETLMLIAAPLCVLGRPLGIWMWALPHRARLALGVAIRSAAFCAIWRAASAPLTAWLLQAVALWAWHAPKLFEAALRNSAVHSLQHASFFVTSLLFWWSVFGEGAHRHTGGPAMLSLFTTMVHTSALGALIALSPGLWYPSYIETCSALGVDPLHDQQLGGLIMWVPGAAAYLIGGLTIAGRWLAAQRATTFLAQTGFVRQDGAP
ncbi:cytochrome c oxidase assembly protein [Paraburkholderia mimosarum]|uniref:cytochrome c oxidase assembly protein n=1 Tax=Paraburkholderia mimosarum TaxID=312026 RepID=UPI001FC8681D|nr:cytochrome c oxidase assembly protein [Paraburkholderia mimosarum]